MFIMHVLPHVAWPLAPFSFLALLALGCGTGTAARAARTDAPTPSNALGAEACDLPGDAAEPWVVDLPADRRVALDAALRGPVALVAYDCKDLVLLRGCDAPGRYAYAGTTPIEDKLDLADTDAVASNLSGGKALSLRLEADMNRGMHLAVGYVLVGQRSTTVARVSRAGLPDHCKAATHFIARATVGAYAVTRSSSADLVGVAEIFERGARASSASRDIRSYVAGDRNACASASPDDAAPPASCAAPVKVHLVRIDDGPAPSRFDDADGPTWPGCPEGSVRRGALCVSEKAGGPRACRPRDEADCAAQCEAGEAASCAALGFMYETGKGAPVQNEKALDAYRRACHGGDSDGCAGLGYLYGRGAGVAVDKARALELLEGACRRGSARACSGIGHEARLAGDVDTALRFLERGCKLGYARACFYAGRLASRTGGDATHGLGFHERACEGGDPRGCLALAGMSSEGAGGPQREKHAEEKRIDALRDLRAACDEADGEACEALADFYEGRFGGATRDSASALRYFERACRAGRWTSCRDAAALLDKGGEGIAANPDEARTYRDAACRNGVPSACPKAPR